MRLSAVRGSRGITLRLKFTTAVIYSWELDEGIQLLCLSPERPRSVREVGREECPLTIPTTRDRSVLVRV